LGFVVGILRRAPTLHLNGEFTGMEDRIITYGGQAVLEGVLMRGQKALAIAMRAPNGEIVVHTEKLSGLYQSKITKIPFLRGVILLWDALGLGMKALTLSANTQTGEDEKLEGPLLYGTLAVSMAFGIGLFFLAPYGVGKFGQWLGLDVWSAAALEGVFRLVLIVGYMWAIGQMADIKRVFMYHGAEHKTINAFEAGAELTPENVAKFPLEHPRCGTSFLLTLAVLSILAFYTRCRCSGKSWGGFYSFRFWPVLPWNISAGWRTI
jgi:uncharacterized protein YqhQ